MKKIFLPCLFLTSFYFVNFGQTPDWSTSVAAIFYNNCTSCHHSGGIGPFALETYQDAVDNAANIQENVVGGEMPPWPADLKDS